MIARVWHGYTTPEHADAYEAMLKPELLPGLSEQRGFQRSVLLRRNLGHEVEFITMIYFDSLENLKAAAGHDDYERAIVPPERRQYLKRFDDVATHYEVASVALPVEV